LAKRVAHESEWSGWVGSWKVAKATFVELKRYVELSEQTGDPPVEVGYTGEDAVVGHRHEPLRNQPAPMWNRNPENPFERQDGNGYAR
jgi:hypothetical protein